MFELTAEMTIFVLRLALLALLYLFLLLVVGSVRRDLRRTSAVAAAAATAAPGGDGGGSTARLVVLDPGQTGLEPGADLPLRPVTRLGRSSGSTIVLNDKMVSGEHAVISFRDGGWWLADRGSTNGTVVNDQPVRGEVGLAAGDVIGLGQIRLKVAS
jgi:pSer/pThr/pTyr-binding forkhead associated (FHA) protein